MRGREEEDKVQQAVTYISKINEQENQNRKENEVYKIETYKKAQIYKTLNCKYLTYFRIPLSQYVGLL